MIDNLITIALKKGYKMVNLFCHKNLIEFYEKLGFKNISNEESPRLGKVYLMEKNL